MALEVPGATTQPRYYGRGPDAVFGYGRYGRPSTPLSQGSFGQAYDFGQSLIPKTKGKINAYDKEGNPLGTSAVGLFQMTGSTMENYAKQEFGENWRDMPFTAENQIKVAKRIYEDAQSGNMKNIWPTAKRGDVGAYKDVDFDTFAKEVTGKESGMDYDYVRRISNLNNQPEETNVMTLDDTGEQPQRTFQEYYAAAKQAEEANDPEAAAGLRQLGDSLSGNVVRTSEEYYAAAKQAEEANDPEAAMGLRQLAVQAEAPKQEFERTSEEYYAAAKQAEEANDPEAAAGLRKLALSVGNNIPEFKQKESTLFNIAAFEELTGNTARAQEVADQLRRQRAYESIAKAQEPPLSGFERFKRSITGEERMTPEMEELLPIDVADFGFKGKMRVDFAQRFGSTEDVENTIRDLGWQVSYDMKGNTVATNPETGDRYAISRPGLTPEKVSQTVQGAILPLAFAGPLAAAGGGGILATGAAFGGTDLATQALLKESAGREISPWQAALAATTAGGLRAAERGLGAGYRGLKGTIPERTQQVLREVPSLKTSQVQTGPISSKISEGVEKIEGNIPPLFRGKTTEIQKQKGTDILGQVREKGKAFDKKAWTRSMKDKGLSPTLLDDILTSDRTAFRGVWGQLSPTERVQLKAGLMAKVAQKSGNDWTKAAPLLTKLNKTTGLGFNRADKQFMQGSSDVLEAIKSSYKAAKPSDISPAGLVFADIVAGGGSFTSSAIGIAALTKMYQSPPVRNALIRLANTPKGSTAYEKALKKANDMVISLSVAAERENTKTQEEE